LRFDGVSVRLNRQDFPGINGRKEAKMMLISHPYIKISRKIKNNVQHCVEYEEKLVLSQDKITSACDQFHLSDILDMSYKPFSGNSGFLYLHTNRGLYSFHTRTHPRKFILTYQQLRELDSI
jgi:hypothetical protein